MSERERLKMYKGWMGAPIDRWSKVSLFSAAHAFSVEIERQRLEIVNLMGSQEICEGGDNCDVMVGCRECGRIGRYQSLASIEVEKLKAEVARQIEKGAGYIADGERDADDASADTFEEAAKMLAWLAEHGTMSQAVGQAIKDFRAKAKELRGDNEGPHDGGPSTS